MVQPPAYSQVPEGEALLMEPFTLMYPELRVGVRQRPFHLLPRASRPGAATELGSYWHQQLLEYVLIGLSSESNAVVVLGPVAARRVVQKINGSD